MARFKGFSVLLCTGMVALTVPAQAGFEYSPPKAPPVPAASPVLVPEDAIDGPMPIVPNDPVTAEPLADAGSASAPMPLAAQAPVPAEAATIKPEGDPVYIRRQRSTVAVKPPKAEPMDTDALLKATENGESIAMTKERLDGMPAKQTGKLVINPYPLEQTASHDRGGMGTLSVEQAMMEEGGTLRPVATPGKNNSNGLRARAKITSRYDGEAKYLDRSTTRQAAPNTMMAGSLTPIPGGEGEPLQGIDMMPLPPPSNMAAAQPAPAAPQPMVPRAPTQPPSMPQPAIPANYPTPVAAAPSTQANAGGFTEAVGFGRDLPLALAMSQVIPPDYSYAFGQNVNVGSTVSWQGGKPWNEVLNDMLSPNGMRAVIQGKQITIVRA